MIRQNLVVNGSGDESTGGKVRIDLADMDLPSCDDLRADLRRDWALLAEMEKITPNRRRRSSTSKLKSTNKLANPINVGNRKLLIFTAFADTANYLYDNLAADLLERYGLHSVTGTQNRKRRVARQPAIRALIFQTMLTLFSPRSKEKAAFLPTSHGEIDILIGTDCISEGKTSRLRYRHQLRHSLEPRCIISALAGWTGSVAQCLHPARQPLAGHHARRIHPPEGTGRKHDDRRRHRHRRRHDAERAGPNDVAYRKQLRRLGGKSSKWKTSKPASPSPIWD